MSATHWTVENAKHQYRFERDPKDPLFAFKQRCLVHFAVDTELVFMTTKLEGKDTVFLPFNRGHDHGAGNPTVDGDVRTSYLWRKVLTRDSLMDILARFIHLDSTETTVVTEKVLNAIVKSRLFSPLPPAQSSASPHRPRSNQWAGAQLPYPAFGRFGQIQFHCLACPPAIEPTQRKQREDFSLSGGDHRPAGVGPAITKHDFSV